jgi:hypothetical protein
MGKQRFLYDNGLPMGGYLPRVLDSLWARVKNRKSVLIIIDGGLGEGKTTIMLHILDYFNKINGLPEVELPGCQFAIGGKDFLNKMRECHEKKLPCIGYDEAGDFSRRAALSQFNQMLNRTFETFRAFNCVVVMTLPSFHVLDAELIDKNIPRLLIHLKKRGKTYGNYYGFSLYKIQLLKYYASKTKIKAFAFSRVWPNIYGHFLDLTPERSKKLDAISTASKLGILEAAETKLDGLVNLKDIAKKTNRSVIAIRNVIYKLKVKEEKIIKMTKYYHEEVIDQVLDFYDRPLDDDRPTEEGDGTEV